MYRGGYSPDERRAIEGELHIGAITAVAATNALELGIDVGALDLTLHLGFQVRQQICLCGFDMQGRRGIVQVTCTTVGLTRPGALYIHPRPSPPTAAQGSVASLWQQAGRAGRREQHSLSIYVAFDGPLDQHFMRHPNELFARPIENAMVRNPCSAGGGEGELIRAQGQGVNQRTIGGVAQRMGSPLLHTASATGDCELVMMLNT